MKKASLMALILIIATTALLSQQNQEPYYTGNGRSDMRLGILELTPKNLDKDLDYLPSMIQGVLVTTISKYSAIDVLDRVSLDKVLAETLDPTYEDNVNIVRVGHVAQVGFMLNGSITRTSTGYSLQINITDTSANARTTASYSGTCTVIQLDDHSAIQRATKDLLSQLGVQLTQRATRELDAAASQNQITSQINLAQGITAQRRGTEVAALSYFFQAAANDPSNFEAISRQNVMVADISTGNIGADARNEIAWRNAWLARLTETEVFFYNMLSGPIPPFTLFYATDIKREGGVNFTRETVDMKFDVNMRANSTITSIEKVTKAVYDGLQSTKQTTNWGLSTWPFISVTDVSPFNMEWDYPFVVTFELLNDGGQVIARSTHILSRVFTIAVDTNNNIKTIIDYDRFESIIFRAVNVNQLTDILSIRIATINETPAHSANLSIIPITTGEFDAQQVWSDKFIIEMGVLKGFTPEFITENGLVYDLAIPSEMWGEAISTIGENAFRDKQIKSVVIGDGITHIGNNAFYGNGLNEIALPNSITEVGQNAFGNNSLSTIIIGNNVNMYDNSFGMYRFSQFYNLASKRAGTYRRTYNATTKENYWDNNTPEMKQLVDGMVARDLQDVAAKNEREEQARQERLAQQERERQERLAQQERDRQERLIQQQRDAKKYAIQDFRSGGVGLQAFGITPSDSLMFKDFSFGASARIRMSIVLLEGGYIGTPLKRDNLFLTEFYYGGSIGMFLYGRAYLCVGGGAVHSQFDKSQDSSSFDDEIIKTVAPWFKAEFTQYFAKPVYISLGYRHTIYKKDFYNQVYIDKPILDTKGESVQQGTIYLGIGWGNG